MDSRYYDHKKLQLIREKHYTQEQLAKLLNKHVKTISRVETGKSASYPLIADIMKLCREPVKSVLYDMPLSE